MIDYLYALILGIVEGITEFLPVSSNGHLIVASAVLHFPSEGFGVVDRKAFADTFSIFIQLGAILALLLFYRVDLLQQMRQLPKSEPTRRFWLYLLIAFLPAAAVGFLLRDWIKQVLFSPLVVGIALVVGGAVLLWVERKPLTPTVFLREKITFRHALLIGIAQMAALIPGVSRSGASIVGGLLTGLDRRMATVFSFYLALPTLGVATVYEIVSALRKGYIVGVHLPLFFVGTVAAFIVAYTAVGWLLHYVANGDFRLFGIYRIIAGGVIILLALFSTTFVG